jgi:NADPH:quinone reductase-like Zn-dependent oxidoreductase
MAAPTRENLERLAQLLDAGILRVHIQNTYGLDHAGDALHTLGYDANPGKLGIQVA